MQVTYVDLVSEAENQGMQFPDGFETDTEFYEAFAKWAGFKKVEHFYDWHIDVTMYECNGPDYQFDYDVDQLPYVPDMPVNFDWKPLIRRAIEHEYDLSF